jgi:hypothetical protein
LNTSVKLLHRGRPCSQAAGSLPRMAARLDFGLTGDYGGGRVLGGVRALKLKSSERCTHGRQCQSRTINVATIVSHESESSSNGMLYPHTPQKLVPACQTIRRQPTSLRRGTSRQSPTPATTPTQPHSRRRRMVIRSGRTRRHACFRRVGRKPPRCIAQPRHPI